MFRKKHTNGLRKNLLSSPAWKMIKTCVYENTYEVKIAIKLILNFSWYLLENEPSHHKDVIQSIQATTTKTTTKQQKQQQNHHNNNDDDDNKNNHNNNNSNKNNYVETTPFEKN